MLGIELLEFVKILEKYLGKKAIMQFQPMQPGDVEKTYADINKLKEWIGYNPQTDFENGIKYFVKWFLEYKNN